MRRFLISLVGVFAVFAVTAGLAASATKRPAAHPSVVKCDAGQPGAKYLPPCTAPTVVVRSIVACEKTGTRLTFPITVRANAGLASATVRFRGKTIAHKTFPGNPVSASFRVRISTRGFKPGLFTLTASVTDTLGKHARKSAHFTICKPAPVFTG